MTKVNGLIDTLKYIPIYANMTLHMWARVWGKDKKLTFATIINNIVFSCIVDADINNGLSALQGRCHQYSVISISQRPDIMVANVAAASTIPRYDLHLIFHFQCCRRWVSMVSVTIRRQMSPECRPPVWMLPRPPPQIQPCTGEKFCIISMGNARKTQPVCVSNGVTSFLH